MAEWYVDPVNGLSTNGGASWADAVDSPANLPPVVANGVLDPGDVVKLADTGRVSGQISDWTPDLSAGPLVAFVGYDPITDTPLSAPNLAGVGKYGGFTAANAYCEAILLHQQTNDYWFQLGEYRAGGQLLHARRCLLNHNPPSGMNAGARSNSNVAPSRAVLEGCTINANGPLRALEGAELIVRGGSLGGVDGVDGALVVDQGILRVTGLDVSAMTSGALVNCLGGHAEIDVVGLPTGVSLFASGVPPTAAPGLIVVRGRDFYAGIDDAATWDLTTAVSRAGGATLSDGSAASLIASTSSAMQPGIRGSEVILDEALPLDLSADRTVSVYLAQVSGAAQLTTQDVWLTIEFEGASGYRAPTTRPASAMTGGAALPTDTASTWNGLTAPVAQRIDLTVTADPAGAVRARVTLAVAKPGALIYVDPKAVVV